MINEAREVPEIPQKSEKPKYEKAVSPPNYKQKRFVKKLLEGHNTKDATRLAGYKDPGYGYELKKTDSIKSLLLKEMEKTGIHDELAAKKMMDGLNALAPPKKDGGQQYEDQFVRKQFLDMYFRLRGDYAPTEHNINQKIINIQITPEVAKGLADAGAFDEDIIEGEVIDE